LTHALVANTSGIASDNRDNHLVESDSGLIVADARGMVLFFSQGARELLHRAADVPINHRTLDSIDWAKSLIDRLMRALADVEDAKNNSHHVPILQIHNAAGYFVLRAYWIESAMPGAGKCAAIQIQHQIPLALRLMQSPRLRRMSPRNQQACLLLAHGLSSAEIGKRMGISRDGAVYHIRLSYSQLGISRQEQLVGALLRPQD
jgi:DNA-binding CsgD family transcriptional regulator